MVLTQGGGRFDQAIANLNAFYAYVCLCVCVSVCDRGRHPDKRLRFVMEDSLVFLLCAGEHEIEVDARVAGPVCGLLPLAAACRTVTTSGIRWNLRASPVRRHRVNRSFRSCVHAARPRISAR